MNKERISNCIKKNSIIIVIFILMMASLIAMCGAVLYEIIDDNDSCDNDCVHTSLGGEGVFGYKVEVPFYKHIVCACVGEDGTVKQFIMNEWNEGPEGLKPGDEVVVDF